MFASVYAKSSPSDILSRGAAFLWGWRFLESEALSECPLYRDAAADAFALALPAIEVEVVAHAAVLRHEAVAEFEHGA